MRTLGTIRTFNTPNFRVVVRAEEEDASLDLSWDEDGSVLRGLESGEFVAFCAHAFVIYKPTGAVLADDYLGARASTPVSTRSWIIKNAGARPPDSAPRALTLLSALTSLTWCTASAAMRAKLLPRCNQSRSGEKARCRNELCKRTRRIHCPRYR